MPWTTPGTAVAGSVLTAAYWNTQVRDNLNMVAPLMTTWTDYSPTLSQGVTVTYTKNYAKYVQIGKFVWVNAYLSATSSGTSGSIIAVTLPVTAATSTPMQVGSGSLYRSAATTFYSCSVILGSTTSVWFVNDASGANVVGTNPSYQMVSNDAVRISLFYEAA